MISIHALSKTFKSNHTEVKAVDNLNLTIKKGEIYGVIGYSGAGKSTFIRLINRLEDPTSGNIEIDGNDVTSLSKKGLRLLRQEIGMIFQHFNLLWSRTVRDNIGLPLEVAGLSKGSRYKRVDELIELVGLTGRENAYPSELSGGQKQRVGIARALANNPKVLLCDEATSALDPETTDSILDLLVSINKKLNLTIILITHEMHVIRKICHRVSVMEEGRVVEEGSALDVFMYPKHETTQRFVQQVTSTQESDDFLKAQMKSKITGEIIRLHFLGGDTNRAIISQIAKQFEVEVNILQGNITQTQEGAYGTLIVHITGDPSIIEAATKFIENTNVQVEVLENA